MTATLYDRQEGLGRLIETLQQAGEKESELLVGHNIAYDLACALNYDGELQGAVGRVVWRAYDNLAVQCTRIRERLIDIARGSRFTEDAEGELHRKGHSLAEIAKQRIGLTLDKETWRLNYQSLDGMPLWQWPQGAREYALTDAGVTYSVWEHQEAEVKRTLYGGRPYDMWTAECGRQAAYAFAFQLMRCWGLTTDQARVRELRGRLAQTISEKHRVLLQAGLVDPKKGSKKLAAIRDLVEKTWAGEGEVPLTPKHSIQTSAAVLEQCDHPALDALIEYAHAEKQLGAFVEKLEAAGSLPIHADYDVLGANTGRTSARQPAIQQQPREPGVRECFVARPGRVFVACDFDNQEVRTFAQVLTRTVGRSHLAEQFQQDPAFDAHTAFAAHLLKIEYAEALARKKAKDADMLAWRQRAKACFHPDTEILTRTRGWQRIGQLTYEDEVAAAYPQRDGECVIAWERPTALTRRKAPTGELVHLKNKGIDLKVTPDHRMLGFRQNGDPYVTTPEKLPKARYWAGAGVMSAGTFPGGEQDWSMLRLAVAVQADGSFTRSGIRLGFTKTRKIERMRELLKGVEGWTESRPRLVTNFYLSKTLSIRVRRLLTVDKTLPQWWINLPLRHREMILEEARHWDGSVRKEGRRFVYSTTKRQNADVLQAIAALSGHKSRLTLDHKAQGKHAAVWKLSIGDHSATRGDALEPTRRKHRSEVVCLSVPSSFVLVRDGGIPVVTGQCIFGIPGGMGVKTFRLYAKGYGLSLTLQEAEELKAQYFAFEPWAKEYFQIIGNLTENGEATMQQLYSGRLRGGCTFPSAANTLFQGLAADVSKSALWDVTKACYGAPGTEGSPLGGCRPVAFLHDEILLEAPEEYAHEAAVELARVMCAAMEELTPDVPARASPTLMRHWSKKAEAVKDADGRLIPWEDAK
jgi:hypothetical protein